MSRRQTPRHDKMHLPRIWLMTDPRFGEGLMAAIRKLPTSSGVIFRHYDLTEARRLALFQKVRRICRQRGHIILLAGDERTALRWRADGYHSRACSRLSKRMISSTPVHDRRELAAARRFGADMILLSPVFATASHPGAQPLGRTAFIMLAKQCAGMAAIALGGMTRRKAATLDKRHIHGWAAIDAFRF